MSSWLTASPSNGSGDHADNDVQKCTARCEAAPDCVAFSFYLAETAPACYIFHKEMIAPFTVAGDLTCVKNKNQTAY